MSRSRPFVTAPSLFLLAVVLLVLRMMSPMVSPAAAQSTRIVPKAAGPPRVLMLLSLSRRLSRELSARHRDMEIEATERGAVSLGAWRQSASSLGVLRSGAWDFVVLSGHPTFGRTLVIDGESRIGDPSAFLRDGRMLLAKVRESGARAVLLVPPRRPGAPAVDQQAIDWAYTTLARGEGAVLAPVSDAFARVHRRRPDLALFDPYGTEWSATGAFLAAAVLEATLTGRPPTTPETLGEADDPSAEAAMLLDEEAWAAVRDLAAEGGTRQVPPPPFPSIPTLPKGAPLSSSGLVGTWRGPLRLYPWPATLELTIAEAAEGVHVAGRVRFDDQREGLELTGTGVRLERQELSFRNPADLAGGRTLYRLVSQAGRLKGVAELVTENHGAYAIGGFELTRLEPARDREQPGR